jgi:hypothetical protein
VGGVGATLTALLPPLKEKRNSNHLAQARGHYSNACKALDHLAKPSSPATSACGRNGPRDGLSEMRAHTPRGPPTYDTINLLKMTNINKSRLHLNAGLNSSARSILVAASTRLGR